MTKYILDSNSFIAPFNDFYRMSVFPTFWEYYKGKIIDKGSGILVPRCVLNELAKGDDDLAKWAEKVIKPVVYDETSNNAVWLNYGKVINYISNGNYKNAPVANWKQVGKADPLLIAIAMTFKDAKIVTFEKRSGSFERDEHGNIVLKDKHSKIKKEPKIPDVADQFNIECITLYDLEEQLGMKI